jgi:hypothetical protein
MKGWYWYLAILPESGSSGTVELLRKVVLRLSAISIHVVGTW